MPESDRIRWDARYREAEAGPGEVTPFLSGLGPGLPGAGTAIDVAGGRGRNAVWLARRGLDVTLADISEVALGQAQEAAAEAGVALRTLAADLEIDPFPPGPWDMIVCVRFLWRPLYRAAAAALRPGGLLVIVHPTRSNLARHARPGPDHLLEDGELPGLVGGLETLVYEESWGDDGRHEARLLARRPG